MATPTPQPRPVNGSRPPGVPAAAAASPKPSRLASVKRGQLRSALRYMFYGPEGVGKSSLAADAPSPIFFDVEGGTDNIDVARYPFQINADGSVPPGGYVPRTYAEVVAGIDDLIANPTGYETLVIDTIDALEALLHRHICEVHGKANVEAFGYGKGYNVALDEFRALLRKLEDLRAKGISVVMLGHAIVKTFKNPTGEDYDKFQLRLNDKAAGLLKERSDVVGFIRFDGGSAKLKGDTAQTPRARGWVSGRRLIHLANDAAWDAKSRLALPAELELGEAHPWAPFAEAEHGARDATNDSLLAEVTAELDRIGSDEFTTSTGRTTSRALVLAMVANSDASTISRVLTGLRATTAVTVTQES